MHILDALEIFIHILDAVIFMHILDAVRFMHISYVVIFLHMICYVSDLVCVLCADFSLCYVQSLVCVMCSLQFVFCVAFSVSGWPLKWLAAALLIHADIYIYIYI